jgi:RNA polymerase sigma-70 factor (ECF subfamily)
MSGELHAGDPFFFGGRGDAAAEEADTQELVARFKAGDTEAFAPLYEHYFDRVFSYLRLVLKGTDEAQDATQTVFLKVFEALPRYQPRKPFEAWLFTIVRNTAFDVLRLTGRIELEENEVINKRRERPVDDAAALSVLEWIKDNDLSFLVERLPLAQRQVLLLRYLLDLTSAEAAKVMGRTAGDVRILQFRALRFLEDRLTSLGRAPTSSRKPDAMRAPMRHSQVLRERRFTLKK